MARKRQGSTPQEERVLLKKQHRSNVLEVAASCLKMLSDESHMNATHRAEVLSLLDGASEHERIRAADVPLLEACREAARGKKALECRTGRSGKNQRSMDDARKGRMRQRGKKSRGERKQRREKHRAICKDPPLSPSFFPLPLPLFRRLGFFFRVPFGRIDLVLLFPGLPTAST